VFGFLIPLAGMLTGVIITGMLVLGPIGRAVGEAIRHWLAGGRKEKLEAGHLDDLADRLSTLERQVSELSERQDFAERLLAQVKRERVLPGGTDVAG
jgi:hypothetical protein